MELVKNKRGKTTEGKHCNKCGEPLVVEKTWRKADAKNYMYTCIDCKNDYERSRIDNDAEKLRRREKKLVRDFGITLADYYRIMEEQSGRCCICDVHQIELSRPFAVDHSHETGQIRGLLCFDCNTSIGKLGDNVAGLERALNYLKRNENCQLSKVSDL